MAQIIDGARVDSRIHCRSFVHYPASDIDFLPEANTTVFFEWATAASQILSLKHRIVHSVRETELVDSGGIWSASSRPRPFGSGSHVLDKIIFSGQRRSRHG
jgi:hypothetical protein